MDADAAVKGIGVAEEATSVAGVTILGDTRQTWQKGEMRVIHSM